MSSQAVPVNTPHPDNYAPLPLDRRAALQETICRRLRSARRRRGLTQQQAAELLGTCRSTYNAMECGRGTGGRTLTFSQMAQFAIALGISLDWLIGRAAPNKPNATQSQSQSHSKAQAQAQQRPVFGQKMEMEATR